jgi:hypothetical protein
MSIASGRIIKTQGDAALLQRGLFHKLHCEAITVGTPDICDQRL